MDSFRCDCTITIKFASGQQSKENNLWQWFLTAVIQDRQKLTVCTTKLGPNNYAQIFFIFFRISLIVILLIWPATSLKLSIWPYEQKGCSMLSTRYTASVIISCYGPLCGPVSMTGMLCACVSLCVWINITSDMNCQYGCQVISFKNNWISRRWMYWRGREMGRRYFTPQHTRRSGGVS